MIPPGGGPGPNRSEGNLVKKTLQSRVKKYGVVTIFAEGKTIELLRVA